MSKVVGPPALCFYGNIFFYKYKILQIRCSFTNQTRECGARAGLGCPGQWGNKHRVSLKRFSSNNDNLKIKNEY